MHYAVIHTGIELNNSSVMIGLKQLQHFFDFQQFSLCMQQTEIIEMINVQDVQLYDLISYLIEKSLYLTV